MRKGERRVAALVLAVLVLALAALVAQRLDGDGSPAVYRVSVLMDGTPDEYWKNFRAGLDRAALEQNVDLRFVTYYDEATSQADALRREWTGGETDGVVLVPAEGGDGLAQAAADAGGRLALSVVGAWADGTRAGRVSPDAAAMAVRLADAAAALEGPCTVYLSPAPVPWAEVLAAELGRELDRRGASYSRIVAAPEALPSAAGTGALVALEPAMAEALCRDDRAFGRVCGAGVSGRLLRALEDGAAAALVVHSGYDAGYLALTQVTDRLAGRAVQDAVLEAYTAVGDNLFDDPMIDILFAAY